jgi:protein-S-isoprenylcysteine O-methyltransferase Ste14
LLHLVAWLACVIYSTIPAFWFMIHPFANRWRQRRRSPYRILLPLWILMWIVMALITAPWRTITIYNANWTWLPAIAMFAAGGFLYVKSSENFTPKQLGGLPEVQGDNNDQRLVTTGIRARVRHPVYLAHLCEMLAWSTGTGLIVCWSLTAFAILTGALMIRLEDNELEKRFGGAYREYRSSVPAVLPRFL